MTNLVFDVGNTNIVVGLINSEKLINRYETSEVNSLVDLELIFNHLDNFDNIVISSVVPKITKLLVEYCQVNYNITPDIVSSNYPMDLVIDTENPSEVGSDLICAAIGASKYSDSGIVIDMGTATKIIFYENKVFKSVIIAPGIILGKNALLQNTALINQVVIDKPDKVFGKNSIECIKSGLVLGHFAMINGLIDLAFKDIGAIYPIYLTGGLSHLILDDLNYDYEYYPNLIIDALDDLLRSKYAIEKS